MARLIDADALLEQYTDDDLAIGGRAIIYTFPTVEAIPIEWLNRIASEWKTRKILMSDTEYIILETWRLTERFIEEWQKEQKDEQG